MNALQTIVLIKAIHDGLPISPTEDYAVRLFTAFKTAEAKEDALKFKIQYEIEQNKKLLARCSAALKK